METTRLTSPFDRGQIDKVRLAAAPLVLVVSQVRHPPLVALADDRGPAVAVQLAKSLDGEYPIIGERVEAQFLVTPAGVTTRPSANRVWQLQDKTQTWRVSLSKEFVALDTSAYTERDEFSERFERLVAAYGRLFAPPSVTRVGIRYVNRIDDPALLERLDELVITEVLGCTSLALPEGAELIHALTQALYREGDHDLKAQWGVLPPGAVIDTSIEPSNNITWILDIDSFTTSPSHFDTDVLTATLHSLASVARRCFRWAVTPAYLQAFREPK